MSQVPPFVESGMTNPFFHVFESLTSRERTILQLAAQDHTCKEIAARMGITKGTVEKHRKNVLKKAGVKGKKGLQRLLRQFELHFR
ncbi:LuxR C-terminal-related transcriptional regulator [Larkinella sp.]|uniref:LuxR C-terminal-related transcriptional regulator n=1 Tax=Larkinella sp. TaxID=2034517 RepID=UPI003BA9EED2